MPRCRKILANGKRCKAHAIAGSKFCLFHTPGQKMKRRKKSTPARTEKKSTVRRTTENQLAVRSSKKLAAYTAAYGASLQSRPGTYIFEKKFEARRNKSGKVIVGEHTQRTVMHSRSEGGRNFVNTDGSHRGRIKMGQHIVYGGRLIPVLGYGFVAYNTFGGPAEPGVSRDVDMISRTHQGATLLAVGSTVSHYQSGGSTINLLTAGRFL